MASIWQITLSGYDAQAASESGQTTAGKITLGTWGSYGHETVQVTLAEPWDSCDLVSATFWPVYPPENWDIPGTRVYIGTDGLLTVPPEATARPTQTGRITFEGLADGKKIISADVRYTVRDHAPTSGNESTATPSLLDQVLAETGKNAKTTAEAAEIVEAGRADSAAVAEAKAQAEELVEQAQKSLAAANEAVESVNDAVQGFEWVKDAVSGTIVADVTRSSDGIKVTYTDGTSSGVEVGGSGGVGFKTWAYDADTHYLHLYDSEGLDVIDPVYIPGGSGGSAASTLTFSLSTASSISIAESAEEAKIDFTFTSLDANSQVSTGAGTLQIYVGGIAKRTVTIQQGENTINVREYLSTGSNTVKLILTDSYGTSATRTVTIGVEALSLTWNLGATEKVTDSLTVSLTPVGSGSKTVYILVDGTIYTAFSTATTGRKQTKTISEQTHGAHIVQAYCTMVVGGITLKSETLTCAAAWATTGETVPVIACDLTADSAEQYNTLTLTHRVVDPANNPASVTYTVNGLTVKTAEIDQSEQIWSYRADTAGTLTLGITCGDTSWTHTITVTASASGAEEITDSLQIKLDASAMATLDGWTYNGYGLTLSDGFDAVNGGLQTDSDGIQGIRIMQGDRLTLGYTPFADDLRKNGGELKIVYKVVNPTDYDGIAVQCLNGGIGLDIRANEATFQSEQATLSMITCEGRKTELDLNVLPSDDGSLMEWHVNGALSKASVYAAGDSFTQPSAAGITFGSDTSDVWLYLVRGYSRSLTKTELIANYEADGATAEEINARYAADQVYDSTGTISPELVAECCPDAHVIVFAADTLSAAKSQKVTGTLTHYFTSGGTAHTWTAQNVVDKVQGTSSAAYFLAGLNHDFSCADGFDLEDGTHIDTYSMTDNSIGVNYFNFKLNVASSENINNILMAEWYNKYQPYVRPCRKADPKIRDTVEGHIAVMFYKNTGTESVEAGAITVAPGETVFYGIGCLNNSKKNYAVFGQDDEDDILVIEQLNNTSDQCRGKSDDLTDELFDGDGNFEFRYKSDTITDDEAKALFQTLLTFIVETDTDNVTNLALPSAVTYDGTTYTTDSKEYRLAKYKAEAGDHMIMDSILFQHLLTLTYTLPDNRAKNMFWGYSKSVGKWHLCFAYDMDTAMGNDNEGGLTLKAGYMDTDTIGTKDVFNAADSTIYQNNRLALADDLQALYIELENAGAWDMSAFGKLADTEQSKVCQALWAEDGEKKYLLPLINSGSSAYVPMANGKKDLQRWNFLTFQRPFMSSYFKGSYSVADVCTIRGYTPSTWAGVQPSSKMTITPYYNLWVTVKAGSNVVQKRAGAGEAVTLDLGSAAFNDTEIYPYSASMLQDLGDLSALYPGYCDLAACTRLQKVIIGSSASGYSNTNMTEVSVKNCVMLEELDVQACPNLKQALDLTNNIQLRTLKAKGSGITGASFAAYGRVETVEFPAVSSIQAKQLNYLQSMTLEAWTSLATLVIENCSALDSYAFANAAENLTRVRLIGIDWTVPLSGYDLLVRLHGCGGIDDDGYNTSNGVLTGTVRFTQITQSKWSNIQTLVPELTYTYDEMLDEYTCTYKNEDGTILYETKVEKGGTAPDPVRLGYISTPTKEPDTELVYTYWKWDNDLSGITADTVFTATFTSATRYYNVVFCDKSGTALETYSVAAHGSCKYAGDDLPSDDYLWVGWLTETDDVTTDLTVMPEYIYPTLPVSVLDLTQYDYAYSDDPDDNAAYTKTEFAGILLGGMAKTYLAVGDKIKMVPSTSVIVDSSIVYSLHAFSHYKVSGGDTFAGTTWYAVGVLNAQRQMNTANTNSGGWPATAMRKWLNETLYPTLPPFWRAIIKQVTVMSSKGGTSADIVSSEDHLYIPSQAEVGFDTTAVPYKNEVDADAESVAFACYTDNNSRIKKYYNGTGSAVNWWLRSPLSSSSSYFCGVGNNGGSGNYNASGSYGVAPGFSI